MYLILFLNTFMMNVLNLTIGSYLNTLVFKQYTYWNIGLIFLSIFFKKKTYKNLIAVNSTAVCITFHTYFILQPSLIYIMPDRMNMKFIYFHISSIIVHIIPALYYLRVYFLNNINISHDLKYYLLLHVILWYNTTNLNINGVLYPPLDIQEFKIIQSIFGCSIICIPRILNYFV